MDLEKIVGETNPSNELTQKDLRLWYVVHAKPGNEERVKTNLLNQEIRPYLPLIKICQYSGGRMVERIKPLFPNYLFAKLDLEIHYYRVKWTRGVNKILGSGAGPIPISERVIQTIQEREGKDKVIELVDEFKEGDVVQVTSGPFKDLMGIFKRDMSSRGRVKILLSLVGVDIPVQIPRYQIKKVA